MIFVSIHQNYSTLKFLYKYLIAYSLSITFILSMQNQLQQRLNDVTIKAEKAVFDDDLYINLSITTPEAPAVRPSVSIICVLDISGSMDTEATQGGAVESDGFSRLDLVKHSVNTIINSLSENDVLGIVTFSDSARVDLALSEMTKQNKQRASDITNKMRTEGSTNLWDGIRLGLQQTKHQKCKSRNTFVVVLSDGEPNQHPPKGELQATREYIQAHPLSGSMSMFGYGYALDTELLAGLTELGGGCFGYIPDCSMIGTIFVNFLSSALSSFSPKLQASVEAKNCEIRDFNGHHNKKVANLGTIQYGVTRNCMIRFKGVPHHQQLGQAHFYFIQGSRKKITVKLTNVIEGDKQNVQVQRMRTQHIEVLQNLLLNSKTDLKACLQIAKKHLQNMKKADQHLTEEGKKKYLSSLIRDFQSDNVQEGQVTIALSNQQYWRKWGIHYFPALKIAHANQMCTNFKDPGLQLYGGQLFKSLQSTMDTVFINLPPPIPSIKKYDAQGNLKVVQDMSNYYDQYGGCIHGGCQVLMADGTNKMIKQLAKGDSIMGLNGPTNIKCIVKTQVNEDIEMIKFQSGLIITKYHPVFLNGKWAFPINEAPIVNINVQAYYNFVLEDGHSMVVNGIACITLGHGFQEEVAKHQYFGTDLIIRDLQRISGWNNGYVLVGNKAFKRDPITLQVVGMAL